MKILAVGDLHGKDCWRTIQFKRYDKVVFIGDYTDSPTASNQQILTNLQQLMELKQSAMDKFILLLGNHDVQYLHFPFFRCSGFRPEAQHDLTNLFRTHAALFQVAFQHRNYLFTHAGLSQSWLSAHDAIMKRYHKKYPLLADALNAIHHDAIDYHILFEISTLRGGIDKYGGIFWADMRETRHDYLKDLHQVVGHTPRKEIKTVGDDHSSITYIDVLDYQTKFYEVTVE